MGHVRLRRLPASRKWREVVALLADGAPVQDIAAASADAAEKALKHARSDPALSYSLWLLTQIPLAARAPDFEAAARKLGLDLGSEPTLMDIVGAYGDAVDRATSGRMGRTDLGAMAQDAAAESLATVAGSDLPSLFGATPLDVRVALGKLAAPDRFALLARDFFAKLTQRHLDYYLSRTLADHVGPGQRFATTADHSAFNAALENHCQEASRIIEAFAGGWFSKTNYQGGITSTKARDFAFVALGKIAAELRRRQAEDG